MKFLILALFLSPIPSFADSLVMEPSRLACQVVPSEEHGAFRCRVTHDGLEVHEGRSVSAATANGDCVKCNTVLNDATAQGKRVRMLRGYVARELADWHLDSFFTLDQPDLCEGQR